MFDLLDEAAVTYQLVLTKIDKIKPAELGTMMAEHGEATAQAPGGLSRRSMPPRARKGTGLPELRAEIAGLILASGHLACASRRRSAYKSGCPHACAIEAKPTSP